jgi:hypothetical protein
MPGAVNREQDVLDHVLDEVRMTVLARDDSAQKRDDFAQ